MINPLEGISITIKETSTGTVTNEEGYESREEVVGATVGCMITISKDEYARLVEEFGIENE